VDEAGTCIRVRPRFAGDKIFRPVTDQTEVTQCWYAWVLYLYSLLLGLVSSCLVVCPLRYCYQALYPSRILPRPPRQTVSCHWYCRSVGVFDDG